jgi:hypothetical protein
VRLSDIASPVLSEERGGVLVMVAIWLPVLLVFLMFVVEVGNWFEHKRHLQLQADAGAFAGGGVFNACLGDSASGSAAVESEARRYAGDPAWVGGVGASAYNAQVGGTNRGLVTVRINRKTYEVSGPGPDDTVEQPPCVAKMVDVKITEADLPWLFRLSFVPAVNAHARVEARQKETTAGSLPVGVPDNNPLAAAAIFVDESDGGTVRAVEPLTKVGTATLNGQSLVQWTGSASAVSLPAPAVGNGYKSFGVVVALSGIEGWTPSGSLSQICNQVLVECYQGADVGPWTGLSHIHGYSTAGVGTPLVPIVRDTILYNVGCADDSGPYFLLNAGCSVGVKAKIDFGPVLRADGDPSKPVGQQGLGAQVKVDGWGCPNAGQAPKGCNMVYNATGANAGYWTTDGSNGYPVMPSDGVAHRVDLNWKTATSTAQTLTGVQRSFSASTATSGPVEYVSVSEFGPGANSLSYGTHDLSVTIAVKQSLQRNTQNLNDPPVALKVVGGSQNQAVDCEEGKNLAAELATGCAPPYTLNKGTPCPSYNNFLSTPQPWNCVRTQTGGQNGQVYQGMLDRTQGGSNTCVNPINWADVNGDGKVTVPEDIPDSDPRIVPVFVTPFGSFSGSGNNVVPVVNFATFYVTGFSRPGGSGQGDPCPGADSVPSGGGYIIGHFIKYVDSINTGGGGALCDFSAFGTCVAVLTQ